jgi:non-ribosomal peptide synthetase component E (peptide arylation enzyme)
METVDGSRIAVRFEGASLTHAESDHAARRLGAGLLAAGIARERVALFMPNCPELARAGAGAGGILHARCDPHLAAAEIERSRVTRIQLLPAAAHAAARCRRGAGQRAALLTLRDRGRDALALDVHRRFRDAVGFEATEVCGMTECFDYAINPLW